MDLSEGKQTLQKASEPTSAEPLTNTVTTKQPPADTPHADVTPAKNWVVPEKHDQKEVQLAPPSISSKNTDHDTHPQPLPLALIIPKPSLVPPVRLAPPPPVVREVERMQPQKALKETARKTPEKQKITPKEQKRPVLLEAVAYMLRRNKKTNSEKIVQSQRKQEIDLSFVKTLSKETTRKVASAIDRLLSKDKKVPTSKEKKAVIVAKEKGKVTLGVEGKKRARGKEKSHPTLTPLTTVDQLVKAIDVLMQVAPKKANFSSEKMFTTKRNINGRERRTQSVKEAEVTLLVGEEILLFLQEGQHLLKEVKDPINGEMVQEKQFIKIQSEQRGISIELTTLKCLIQLLKVRQEMLESTPYQEDWMLVEELGLHTMDYQNYDDYLSLWPIYQALLGSLVREDEEPQYAYHSDSSFASHVIFASQ